MTTGTASSRVDCRAWRFTPVGGAHFTVTDPRTGRLLGSETCDHGVAGERLQILGPASHTCQQWTQWTLVPGIDGTWTVALAGTALTRTVKVLIP